MSGMISIVIPVFNERESLSGLLREIQETADQHHLNWEAIFVDDGSDDGSWEVIRQLASENTRVRGIRLRRNFGKAAALSAGFRAARGDPIVTMDADLQPIVYDTIHPCGCYHLFYPTERVRARPRPIPGEGPFDESMFAPQMAPTLGAGERLLLRISSRSHYLQRVIAVKEAAADAVEYDLRDDNELRALPWPNESAARGFRSAFGPDGLIAGSERLERFLFWPMGIASAGQMRQWGRHATAFVGRRHFDDPDLFERYFEPARGAGSRGAD